MREMTIGDILEDFKPETGDRSESLTNGRTITLWVTHETKSRYDRLQEKSGRKFSKKAREMLNALMAAAEEKIA